MDKAIDSLIKWAMIAVICICVADNSKAIIDGVTGAVFSILGVVLGMISANRELAAKSLVLIVMLIGVMVMVGSPKASTGGGGGGKSGGKGPPKKK